MKKLPTKTQSTLGFGLALILSLACGGDSPPTPSPEALTFRGAKVVQSRSKLPDCDRNTAGQLFFVLRDAEFRYCDGDKYIVIDLRGPAGGIDWLGSLAHAPAAPEPGQAYFHTGELIACIFDDGRWQTLIATDQSGSCAPLPSAGLVAWYPLDGDGSDASGNGNDGTVIGATTAANRRGESGSAMAFGGDKRVEIPDSPSLDLTGALSVSAWVKVSASTGDHQVILSKWYASEGQIYVDSAFVMELQPNGEIPQLAIYGVTGDNYSDASSSEPIDFGVWHHIAGIWDGQTVTMYVDNQLVLSLQASGAIPATGALLTIGAHPVGGDRNGLHGAIDDVRVYNRALTAAEVNMLFLE